jgi:hypothetical protein
MSRWVIRLEMEDGQTATYGTWRESDDADRYAAKLREASSHYSDHGAEVAVSVELIEPWPGIRSLLKEMTE